MTKSHNKKPKVTIQSHVGAVKQKGPRTPDLSSAMKALRAQIQTNANSNTNSSDDGGTLNEGVIPWRG